MKYMRWYKVNQKNNDRIYEYVINDIDKVIKLLSANRSNYMLRDSIDTYISKLSGVKQAIESEAAETMFEPRDLTAYNETYGTLIEQIKKGIKNSSVSDIENAINTMAVDDIVPLEQDNNKVLGRLDGIISEISDIETRLARKKDAAYRECTVLGKKVKALMDCGANSVEINSAKAALKAKTGEYKQLTNILTINSRKRSILNQIKNEIVVLYEYGAVDKKYYDTARRALAGFDFKHLLTDNEGAVKALMRIKKLIDEQYKAVQALDQTLADTTSEIYGDSVELDDAANEFIFGATAADTVILDDDASAFIPTDTTDPTKTDPGAIG